MDNATMIIDALSKGAAVIATGMAGAAAKDGYDRLKALVAARFSRDLDPPEARTAVEWLDRIPEKSAITPLTRAVYRSSADEDDEILSSAKSLLNTQTKNSGITVNKSGTITDQQLFQGVGSVSITKN
jgi:succinylarginine dihydrolase